MAQTARDDEQTLTEFRKRVRNEWLPTFCSDPDRRYPTDGFRPDSITVTPIDARDFLRALEHGLVVDSGGGRYRAPLSNTFEQIFWTWTNAQDPKPITLWLEPVITIAALARLHLDYGWPRECLGTQSAKNWAFDLFVVKPKTARYYIASEVKKTDREVDQLVTGMRVSCAEGEVDIASVARSRLNAHKKWLGLKQHVAPFFWAMGSGNRSRLFAVRYSDHGPAALEEVADEDILPFPGRP
jgi:hypothetical protein